MNGVHDLGGMDGFGAVVREENEPVFHADWERRMFALAVSVMGGRHFNVDEFRRAIERMPPAQYLASTYYERWLYAIEALLVEKGVIGTGEVDKEIARPDADVTNVPDPSGALMAVMSDESAGGVAAPAGDGTAIGDRTDAGSAPAASGRGVPLRYDSSFKARFREGDRVIARNLNSAGHTRIPRYVRGKHGVIYRDWGVFVFPDTHAHGGGTAPQHCYCVAFGARELWGDDHRGGETIYIDLWENYLEPDREARPLAAKRHAEPKKSVARKTVKPTVRTASAVKPARANVTGKASMQAASRIGKHGAAKKPVAKTARKSIARPARKRMKKK